jgi:hypothetical protein
MLSAITLFSLISLFLFWHVQYICEYFLFFDSGFSFFLECIHFSAVSLTLTQLVMLKKASTQLRANIR